MNISFEKTKAVRCNRAGFTLLELMIVMSIIFILMGMAVGNYRQSVQRAREAVLHADLKTMRDAIDNSPRKKRTPPQSLEDLANAGYLREIPKDPITLAKDWQVDYGDTVLAPDQSGSGITGVHSASP